MPERSTLLAAQLDAAVGEEISDKIMQGYEEIASANPAKQSVWWKSAMDRMDQLVDEATRVKVMEQCGYRCAWKGVAEKIKKARKKSSTMDEFWDNLQALYPRHVPLERAKEGTPPISMGGLLPTEVGSVHLLAKWFSTG